MEVLGSLLIVFADCIFIAFYNNPQGYKNLDARHFILFFLEKKKAKWFSDNQ